MLGKEDAYHMNQVLYTLVQATWGFPQTAAGLAVFLRHVRKPHFRYHGAIVTLWGKQVDLSLGLFLFMEGELRNYENPEATDPPSYGELLVHEYGHTIQSLSLGPFYLLVVGLSSAIWYNASRLKALRNKLGLSYYSFASERNANWLGERILKLPPPEE